MTIQLHDTLQGRKVPFEPQKAGEVTMYLCGPTVYNYAHIGNARPAVVFDLLARVLRRRYKLTFARNITDVDDKINAASLETGKPTTSSPTTTGRHGGCPWAARHPCPTRVHARRPTFAWNQSRRTHGPIRHR